MGDRLVENGAFHPLVSIVIPVYNGADFMREAIDSALNQTYDSIEVIVVNDGSADDGETDRIARSYGDKIRYFVKPNGGVATALNLGIEKMKGEYFSWLSHDDMYKPMKIEEEVACLQEQGDPTTIIAEGYQVVDASGKYMFHMNLNDFYTKIQLKNPVFVLMRGGIHGCGLLIHRSHFERVGLFDPLLPTTQDYDLCFRMFRGAKICYMDKENVLSRSHDGQGSKRDASAHILECDQLWIRMMDTLTLEEKIEMSGSEYDFYCELEKFLRTNTVYSGATQYAQQRVKQLISMECGEGQVNLENARADNGHVSVNGIHGVLRSILEGVKKAIVKIMKQLFRLGKQLAMRAGIKDKLKRTKIIRKLYQKGIINKLRD